MPGRRNRAILTRMAQAASPARAWIGTIVFAAVVAFVKGYEEPTLTRTYGDQYLNYRRNVPGWWPRAHAVAGVTAPCV
jgi:protein-S-isoprenylcysteine O-methyltransferase Ste14